MNLLNSIFKAKKKQKPEEQRIEEFFNQTQTHPHINHHEPQPNINKEDINDIFTKDHFQNIENKFHDTQISQTQASLTEFNHPIQSSIKSKEHEVVVVNKDISHLNKREGFYYKKYIQSIEKLKVSNPILVERENLKVNFDAEVLNYLVNDLSEIFKEKQALIDFNQSFIMKEVHDTKELTSILAKMNEDNTFQYDIDFSIKEKRVMNDIDYLDILVNSLNDELDSLIKMTDDIEKKLDIYEPVQENVIDENLKTEN
jgi:hypothetical protein